MNWSSTGRGWGLRGWDLEGTFLPSERHVAGADPTSIDEVKPSVPQIWSRVLDAILSNGPRLSLKGKKEKEFKATHFQKFLILQGD